MKYKIYKKDVNNIIIDNLLIKQIENDLQKLIKNGWKPIGGIQFAGRCLLQTLILEN